MKIRIILCLVAVVFLLSGCNDLVGRYEEIYGVDRPSDSQTQPDAETGPEIVAPSAPGPAGPSVEALRECITINRASKQLSNGERVVVDVYYDYPVVSDAIPGSAAINAAFSDVEDYVEGEAEFLFDIYGQYDEFPKNFVLSDYTDARIEYIDENIVSFAFYNELVHGGLSSDYYSFGKTFDLKTGELLSLDRFSWSGVPDTLAFIKAKLLSTAIRIATDTTYFENNLGIKSLEKAKYYISSSGEIIMCFDRYGFYHETEVPTGLFLGDTSVRLNDLADGTYHALMDCETVGVTSDGYSAAVFYLLLEIHFSDSFVSSLVEGQTIDLAPYGVDPDSMQRYMTVTDIIGNGNNTQVRLAYGYDDDYFYIAREDDTGEWTLMELNAPWWQIETDCSLITDPAVNVTDFSSVRNPNTYVLVQRDLSSMKGSGAIYCKLTVSDGRVTDITFPSAQQ